jgi:large conductance mechanosensitive channel
MNEEIKPVEQKKKFTAELFAFLKEYSVIGLAIGVITAQISKDMIDSVVKGLFMPFINLFLPGDKFSALVFTIGGSRFDFGSVLNSLLTFSIVLIILYIIVKKILKKDEYLKK